MSILYELYGLDYFLVEVILIVRRLRRPPTNGISPASAATSLTMSKNHHQALGLYEWIGASNRAPWFALAPLFPRRISATINFVNVVPKNTRAIDAAPFSLRCGPFETGLPDCRASFESTGYSTSGQLYGLQHQYPRRLSSGSPA